MALYTLSILLLLAGLIKSLKNQWYFLHIAVTTALVFVSTGFSLDIHFYPHLIPKVILSHLVVINCIEFFLYWLDKERAKNRGRRIPEKVLLSFALLGATPAAFYASRTFRHKTKKESFRQMYWLILGIQLVAVLALTIF